MDFRKGLDLGKGFGKGLEPQERLLIPGFQGSECGKGRERKGMDSGKEFGEGKGFGKGMDLGDAFREGNGFLGMDFRKGLDFRNGFREGFGFRERIPGRFGAPGMPGMLIPAKRRLRGSPGALPCGILPNRAHGHGIPRFRRLRAGI